MFVSHLRHEFAIPPSLSHPGVQHWRRVEVLLHAPWFLLTVDVLDEESDVTFARTWCIAWERDLVHALATIDTAEVKSLMCMRPAWLTSAGQWTAREVREVWLTRTQAAEEFVSLCDAAGEEFDGGVRPDRRGAAIERRLLLALPAMPHTRSDTGARRASKSVRGAKGTQ